MFFSITNILFFSLFSCKPYLEMPSNLQKELFISYNGKNQNNHENLFDIKGYYTFYKFGSFSIGPPNTKHYKQLDSVQYNMFFFPDGVFAYCFYVNGQFSDNVKLYFDSVYDTKKATPNDYWASFNWGMYKLTGDTIITWSTNRATLNSGWDIREQWFKIIDRQTLKSIYARPIGLDYLSQEDLEKYWYNRDRYSEARFTPLEKMPSSDNWLKREKWFWCNEEDWKNYMDSVNLNSTK